MKQATWSWLLVVLLGSCRSDPGRTSAPAAASAAALASPAATGTPQDALDRLDARMPLPLLPLMAHHQKQNMRDHLAAVQEILAAVAIQDFEVVTKAAARIGYSDAMGRMCAHLGAGAPGFAEAALKFHHRADEIVAAAKDRDAGAVLSALSTTLNHCTSCHATYKQRIVDEATWSELAGAPPHALP